jgi:hypothetical protein
VPVVAQAALPRRVVVVGSVQCPAKEKRRRRTVLCPACLLHARSSFSSAASFVVWHKRGKWKFFAAIDLLLFFIFTTQIGKKGPLIFFASLSFQETSKKNGWDNAAVHRTIFE